MTYSGRVMLGSFDHGIVNLSVLISILAASAALALAGRVAAAHDESRVEHCLCGHLMGIRKGP